MWTIGEVRVTEIAELTTTSAAHWLLPEATADRIREIEWMVPHYATPDGKVHMTIRALVVESDGRRILVDTCLGNDKERPVESWSMRSGPFLDDLAAAGFPPESIDTVLCTHLHVDHVGWNTRLVDGEWVPTFPNARYLFADVEWEHWQRDDSGMDQVLRADSIQPVIDAGLVDLVATDARLTSHVSLAPTPGHTPGHVSVLIESGGERAVITGDLSHMVCQATHPEWGSSFDVDPAGAEATRRGFFAGRADTDELVFGTHWEPCAGYVKSHGDVWRVEPAG
ncbi:MAG: MBL fold metallo-hydrolase [Ilumatobacteraceae bacterium]|jgi:glyoxylase-like metal-dependent hydrolase (beta-lactamase superfamily II)